MVHLLRNWQAPFMMKLMTTDRLINPETPQQQDAELDTYYQLQHLQYLAHKLLDIHQLDSSDLDEIYGYNIDHLAETLTELKALLDDQGSERGVPFWSEGISPTGTPILHHASKFCGTCQLEAQMDEDSKE